MKKRTIEDLTKSLSGESNISTGHSPEDQALLESIDKHNQKYIHLLDKDSI